MIFWKLIWAGYAISEIVIGIFALHCIASILSFYLILTVLLYIISLSYTDELIKQFQLWFV